MSAGHAGDRRRIVLDCDPGIDDAIAILCAHRYADLVAITTVSGNVGLAHTTRNALFVAQLAGLDVEVHSGASHPMGGPGRDRDAAHVHGKAGLGDVSLPPLERSIASDDAVGFLIGAADAATDLIAVGPLTNIAHAIVRDPLFLLRWRSFTIMGGAIDTGNATPHAEFNMWADPEAADVVFRADARARTMVPLDLTEQVMASPALTAVLDSAGTATARFAARVMRFARRTPAMHDPCAVLAVTHPGLFGLVPELVAIALDGDEGGRTARHVGAPNCTVGYDVDADAVLGLIRDACIDPFQVAR